MITTLAGQRTRIHRASAITLAVALASIAQGQTLSTIYSFSGTDGAGPQAPLTLGANGNFYGTTAYSSSGGGTVFEITPNGALTTFYVFTPYCCSSPQAGLTLGSDGNFYGGTPDDTSMIFKMTPAGVTTVLYTFTSVLEGNGPGPLTQGSDGNFYGTTAQGGNINGSYVNYGTVFQITPAGALTNLFDFDNADGWDPAGALVPGSDGNFYGVAGSGGAHGLGTVFQITPAGALTTIHSFNGGDGQYPEGGLTLGSDGNFYGTTANCGDTCPPSGNGTVFQITQAGVLTTLYTFTGTDGSTPQGGLTQGSDGNFYGTTSGGITGGGDCEEYGSAYAACGTIFKITPAGALTTLHTFSGLDGGTPQGALTLGTDGNFYGTTYNGGGMFVGNTCDYGSLGCGTIYKWCLPGGAKVCTATALSSSLNPSVYADSVTLSAAVTSASGSGTPTGSVSFMDRSTLLGSVPLAGGGASFTIGGLSASLHAVTAWYSGDSNFQGSNGNLPQSVTKSATTTTLVSSLNPSAYDQPFTLTASVVPPGGDADATGTVVFKNGSATLGSATLGNGSASFSPHALSPGTLSITASYNGDANCLASTSTALSQVVNQASTAVVVKASANPVLLNENVTFTAMLTPQYGGAPTGTVTFSANGAPLGSPVTVAGNKASITTSFAAGGAYSIAAAYSGDTNFQSGMAPALSESVDATVGTTTALKSSGSPSALGSPVTFTATVKPNPALGGIPNGDTVTYFDGGAGIGTGKTDSGVATLITSSLAAGTHSITATYAGDAIYLSSTSAVVKQVVDKAATSTALRSNLNPSTYGQSVTFTATVTSSGPTPTGTVTFRNGTATLGTGTLSGGVATLVTTKLAAGASSITAVYNGDTSSSGSTSSPLSQSVTEASTTTTVTSSKNPSNPDQSVTFTAAVTSAYATPAGTVTFTLGSTTLGTVTLAGGKGKSPAVTTLQAGSYTVTATYAAAPPANFTGSSASLAQNVN